MRLISIHHPSFARFQDTTSHLWVKPGFRAYRKAWRAAGFKMPVRQSRQLDHLHSREWATAQGYGYVVLLDVSSGPNMSAGHMERAQAEFASPGYALGHPVFYATEVHWAKLWDLNQLKPGELTKETLGRRAKRS